MGADLIPSTERLALLMTEVPGAASLWRDEPAAMAVAAAQLDEVVARLVGTHGGRSPKPRGEGETHLVDFDDPAAAVACALELVARVQNERWPLREPLSYKVSVHLGTVERRGGDLFGLDLSKVARLKSAAHAGQVVLSSAVAEAVAGRLPVGAALVDMGRHHLKDLSRPVHIHRLVHPSIVDVDTPLRSLPRPWHGLPLPATSFVGRDHLLAMLAAAVEPGRVVALTGATGIGKSRLALEVAARRHEAGDVVHHVDAADPSVDLSPPAEPGDVVVLDDADLRAAEVAAAAEALARVGAAVVVTARRWPTDVAEVVAVGPLEFPPEDEGFEDRPLVGIAACRLLADRVAEVRPAFDCLAADPAGCVRLARLTAGVPLAVELAAARVRLLQPTEVADRLAADPGALLRRPGASGRHASVGEAVGWSAAGPGDPLAALVERG